MAKIIEFISLRKILLILILSVAIVIGSWKAIRLWLINTSLISEQEVMLIDIALISIIGIIIIKVISNLLTNHMITHRHNVDLRLLFQLSSASIILLIIISILGVNLISFFVGIGFLGIILGFATQAVLSNLFSGIILVAFRPFNIGDRIALVNWQYGKFPPSLSHGWLEPSYSGLVREITVMYTKILTDSNVQITIPNGVVTQSLIMNLNSNVPGYVGTQFEVPIQIDPDKLHKSINSQLSGNPVFKGKEETFEILEISPSTYVLSVNYEIEKKSERAMKSALLKAIRLAIISTS
ncbi:MAG: hypothetical protein QG670_974 [Thermoproteota archaeon]|nr:hypothetical protein [Thermoproteota archaeon]